MRMIVERDVVAVGDPCAHRLGGDLARSCSSAEAARPADRFRAAGDGLGSRRPSRWSRTRSPWRRGNGASSSPELCAFVSTHRGPVVGAGVDRRVEHVAEIVGQRREVRIGHVERERCDSGRGEFVPVGRVPQAGRAPHLVALGERAGDRKGDLAGRAGDQDLLAVEHPLVIAHRHPNVKYLICWAWCSCGSMTRSRPSARSSSRSSTSICPPRPRRPRSGRGRRRTCRNGRGAGSGCSSTTAGCCRAIRRSSAVATRTSCSSSCTARSLSRRRDLSRVQPAGRRHHRGVAAVVRHRRAEAAVGGARSCAPR